MASISIRKNKNGTTAYVIRAYVCRDESGKPHYLTRTFTPPADMGKRRIDKELQRLCIELESHAKSSGALDAGQPFAEYCHHFLERKKLSCSDYTLHSYRIALEKACHYIGRVPLDHLNAGHLNSMLQAMNASRSQYGEPYSTAYIRHIQTIVRSCLGMAVREGLLSVNIADRDHYTLPRSDAAEPEFLELSEAREYIRAALSEEDPKIRSMVLLYLYTGVRMEELCGLEWGDIDFERREVHIRRASVYVAGVGVTTKEPKTRAGVRVISADPAVFEALQCYREAKDKEREAAGSSWRETNRIFTKRTGEPIIPGTTAVWLLRFAKKHGLRRVTPHKLRHTYATLQIAYGTDIRTVAGVMGHSSPMTTLTIYAHQVKEASEKAARAMSEMLTPRQPQGCP